MMNLTNNRSMLELAARSLDHLCDKVVFLGGATAELLITDTASMDIRSTYDVDVIIKVTPLSNYHKLEEELRELGFKNDTSEDAVICRWLRGDLIIDIMPTDPEILGFANKWYNAAIDHAERYKLTGDITINLISAPYFIATKLEAFKGRGDNDYYGSRDLEDIIAIINGRIELIQEVMSSSDELKKYIATELSLLLHDRLFTEVIPGHLPQDEANQQRKEIVLGRFRQLSSCMN